VWRDSQDLLLLEEEEDEEKEMISESSVHEYFSSWTTLAVTLCSPRARWEGRYHNIILSI
jgi:hypothetical protein